MHATDIYRTIFEKKILNKMMIGLDGKIFVSIKKNYSEQKISRRLYAI